MAYYNFVQTSQCDILLYIYGDTLAMNFDTLKIPSHLGRCMPVAYICSCLGIAHLGRTDPVVIKSSL